MRVFQGSLDMVAFAWLSIWLSIVIVCVGSVTGGVARAGEPKQGATKQAKLGGEVTIELVYIPPGEFMMGSTSAEKKWAIGQEGGAQFSSGGGVRESFEGEPRPMRVKDGFWMGRTAVTVGQFRRFAEATGFITDAEKPNGNSQCFNRNGVPTEGGWKPAYAWMSMDNKSWRDPNHGIRQQENHPVVCVSYNDMKAFCKWLTKAERANSGLANDVEYRLPTEAEWAYACRGGRRDSSYFWWGNDLSDGEGRLNISGNDLLSGEDWSWPRAQVPWSDGFAAVSPVDHYGERGRNGFGLADMCGGVWEFALDHFDPKGGHENLYYEDAKRRSVSHPVCRGGNFFDVPGNARCAVRLGIKNVTYSDSRDGFRVCLGVPQGDTTAEPSSPDK